MKKFIIGFIIGIVLASASVASAYDYYWAKSGTNYSCQGYPGGVTCKLKGTNYSMSVLGPANNPSVNVFRGGHVLYGCSRWPDPQLGSCVDFTN